ncbi:MAG: NrdH-redoxin [Euzebyaceae bacterium]|jgi:glutaredoxin|nr:NrdH-redoxin [Euzebyaceae bacterium]
MTSPAGITVYWRPGCLFCSSLFRELDQWSIAYDASNIWEHPAAAATVRAAAGGNETVPTVQVGARFLVNPSIDEVLATVHELDPHTSLPPPETFSWGDSWMLRLLTGRRR